LALLKRYLPLLKSLAPFGGLLLLVVFFAAMTKGDSLGISNLQSLSNQVIVTALVATGAIFVFGSGNLDMSMGACVCLSAVLGAMAAIPTGNIWLAFAVCMGSALVVGLLKGVFAAYVEVPIFIVTIVLGMVITAGVLVLMGDKANLLLPVTAPAIQKFNFSQMTLVNVLTLGSFFVLCWVVFVFGALGKSLKILGGSDVVASQTGYVVKRTKILAFLMGAIGTGLAAFIILIRTRTVGASTGSSLGTDVLVALVLGGMPLTGGPRSSIYAGVIGAASITVLTNGLTMMGLPLSVIQTCRGVVFMVVVFIASMSYRTRLLPR
jgi:ribose transport system permease protein